MLVKDHQWLSNFEWIDPKNPSIGKLTMNVIRSNFKTNKAVFIAVVDTSGSMAGNPITQVKTALTHILGLTSLKVASIETYVITYNSTASLLINMNDKSDLDSSLNKVNTIQADGGTNFLAAYNQIGLLLETLRADADNIASVSIAFLTDGQAQNDKSQLTFALRQIFEPYNTIFKIIVHSIGFSDDCDKDLLEKMRTAGTEEGTFRFAEPTDDSDTLCNKLTDIFSLSEKSATVKIHLTLPDEFEFIEGGNSIDSNIFIDSFSKAGSMCEWINTKDQDPPSRFVVTLDSSEDNHTQVPSLYKPNSSETPIIEQWLRKALDGMAKELLDLNNNRNNMQPDLLQLQCALFLARLKTIGCTIDDNRVSYMKNQIQAIQKGGAVNEGKLADMRFSSMFSPEKSKPQENTHKEAKAPIFKPMMIKRIESPVKYTYNNTDTNRNKLEEEIMNAWPKRKKESTLEAIRNASIDDFSHRDNDGNTALHLAAYCGSDSAISEILSQLSLHEDVMKELIMAKNKHNETPLTLAIKRRGFHDSLQLLTSAGGYLEEGRIEPLKEFCINQGYVRTAEMISNLNTSDSGPKLDTNATASYLIFQWESAQKRKQETFASEWLKPMLSKCLVDIVEVLLQKDHMKDFVIPWEWFIDYCFPPKPDHPEVENYVKLASVVLNVQPSLIEGRDQESGDTTLIRSVEKGNLPLVQLILDHGAAIDETNNLGNTALIVACSKRYPCIVNELVERGASIDFANKKGNRAVSAVCQMGPLKTMEFLIAHGAETTFYNTNKDTPLLLACRNGQTDVAKLLLQYYDNEFILFRASIDGFDALFASVEADRPECVRLMLENGVPVDEKTDKDNEILQEATPLHLAAYYGRYESAKVLLEFGADTNARDVNEMTPLHIAVMRNQKQIVELLIKENANPNAFDKVGNTPASFTSNREILDILINPVSEHLHKICSTPLSTLKIKVDELRDILMNKSFINGVTSAKDVLSKAVNQKGVSPLTTAIIYSNIDLVNILKDIEIDPSMEDNRGLTSFVWSQLTKNARIQSIIGTPKGETIEFSRVREAMHSSPESAILLFLGNPIVKPSEPSSFIGRMESILFMNPKNSESEGNHLKELVYENKSSNVALIYEEQKKQEKKCKNTTAYQELMKISEGSLWNAKVEAVSAIASGCNNGLAPAQLVSLFLFTADRNIYKLITFFLCGQFTEEDFDYQRALYPLVKCLWTSIDVLPPFKAEVYVCAPNVDRKLFTVGNTVSSPSFISCTSLWPVALEGVDFSKSGTVFIIKSEKKGKCISSHSNYPNESEVVFAPQTKFIVAKWYRGDVIALGQPNIRDHTFGLTEEQKQVIANNKKPLIIELHEA